MFESDCCTPSSEIVKESNRYMNSQKNYNTNDAMTSVNEREAACTGYLRAKELSASMSMLALVFCLKYAALGRPNLKN